MTSHFPRYQELTMTEPKPTLAETLTGSELRDRLAAENGDLRQRGAEFITVLENCHALLCAAALWMDIGPGRLVDAPRTNDAIVADLRKGSDQASALLTKVQK